jgi:hypothetical protein
LREIFMKTNTLLLSLALAVLPAFSAAGEPVQVKLMHATTAGVTAPLDLDREDASKWLREYIAAAQTRLASELPAAVGAEGIAIDLVSISHPDMNKPANKLFVQWNKETNPAAFIPLVGYGATEKMDIYVALEARVSVPGKEVMVFPGLAKTHVEYTKGVRSTTNFLDALKTAAGPLFDEAVTKAIAAARDSHGPQAGNQSAAASAPSEQ